jgi:hypothetical protein
MTIWEGRYKPNSLEKLMIDENPTNSQTTIYLAHLAGSITALLFLPEINHHHNNVDAFRHCFWSSLISRKINPEWAFRWTMAHEAEGHIDSLYRQMDEYNNKKGIEIFKKHTHASVAELIHFCLIELENGELKDVKNKKLTPTNLEGNIVPNIFKAIFERISEIVDFLNVFHFEKVIETNEDGNTALHDCILKDFEDGFNILVKSLDVNQFGGSGLTPLMLSASLKYGSKYAKGLLNYGADIHLQDPAYKQTALMFAAQNGNLELVELLLPHSNKEIKGINGSRAYDLAISKGHLDIAKLLI